MSDGTVVLLYRVCVLYSFLRDYKRLNGHEPPGGAIVSISGTRCSNVCMVVSACCAYFAGVETRECQAVPRLHTFHLVCTEVSKSMISPFSLFMPSVFKGESARWSKASRSVLSLAVLTGIWHARVSW